MTHPASIRLRPIGFIRSEYKSKVGVPIQTAAAPHAPGALELLPEFVGGLKDLDRFEYLILLTHFHLGTDEPLEVTPFLDQVSHGVFATRAPSRPNRLGLSIVRLVAIAGPTLAFEGNDMIDGTPVLDVKPYVPAFDVRSTERIGWFAARMDQLPGKLSDDRMG